MNEEVCIPTFFTDGGTVYITVNGFTKSVTYNQTKGSTSGSIAAELAAAFNADPASPVTAMAFGDDVQLTSKATGAASNYTLSAGSTWDTANFPSPSFTATPLNPTLIGGTDGPPAVAGCSLGLTINNPIGRRTAMCDEAGAEIWSYDAMGRVKEHKRKNDGLIRSYKYAYNEGGALLETEDVLAGGWKQINDYNKAGRVKKFRTSTGLVYADAITYHPHGAMRQAALGSIGNMIRQDFYNDRLQPCRLHVRLAAETAPSGCIDLINQGSVMDFSYDFDSDAAAGVQNNGNVGEMFDEVQGISYSYAYDALNRLKIADATGGAAPWGYDYDYDAWGNLYNRNLTSGTGSFLAVTPTNNNQLVGYSYDPSGNMLQSPMGPETIVYDAENRIIQVGADVFYKYDGDGNRAMKIVGTSKTVYYRSAVDGQVLKEFVNSGSGYASDRLYAYLNGEHLASYSPPLGGGWKFTFRDHLGTLRVRTFGGGVVISRHDFAPYGEEMGATPTDEDHLFTDQERDVETGLDYFIARHYGSNIGRFLQIDPANAGAAPVNPQSWNAYSYGLNNPMINIDPLGLACVGAAEGSVSMCEDPQQPDLTKQEKEVTGDTRILGKDVEVRFIGNMTGQERDASRAQAQEAADRINSIEGDLSGKEISTIQNIKTLTFTSEPGRSGVNVVSGGFNVGIEFAGVDGVHLAEAIVHESSHVQSFKDKDIGGGDAGIIRREQRAIDFTIGVNNKGSGLGVSPTRIRSLKTFRNDPQRILNRYNEPQNR